MFCGSCMHDNTWARALLEAGVEVSLTPTYTPIRVDEPDRSERKVYFGGLNVYLNSRLRPWRWVPRALTRWLDRPGMIEWATRFSLSNDATRLGRLTLDMLAGESGPHREAAEELAHHIAKTLRPDAVIFSNALLVGVQLQINLQIIKRPRALDVELHRRTTVNAKRIGCNALLVGALRTLRSKFAGPIFCTLQGDDVFLDGLPEPIRREVVTAISERSREFDGFFVHSRFYRDYIARYLRLDVSRFQLLPLSIDPTGHDGCPGERTGQPFTVGYFARIAPEKGLHHLVEAFRRFHPRHPEARLRVGGYLGPQNRRYFDTVRRSARPLGSAFEYIGSPATHAEKVQFYRGLDLLSVPTDFLEPKGLYILEALANGVPVVQPSHGAFPEWIEATGGGVLVPPRDPEELAAAWERLYHDPAARLALGTTGQRAVHEQFSLSALARATTTVIASHQPSQA